MLRIMMIGFKLHGNQDLEVKAISFNKSADVLDLSAFSLFIGKINLKTILEKFIIIAS